MGQFQLMRWSRVQPIGLVAVTLLVVALATQVSATPPADYEPPSSSVAPRLPADCSPHALNMARRNAAHHTRVARAEAGEDFTLPATTDIDALRHGIARYKGGLDLAAYRDDEVRKARAHLTECRVSPDVNLCFGFQREWVEDRLTDRWYGGRQSWRDATVRELAMCPR